MTDIQRDGGLPANTSGWGATASLPGPAGYAGQPGSTIAGRYLVGSRVGRGGMADVYAAEDQLLARPVAIKVFRVDATPDERRRIDEEMRTLASLRHAGLVTVFDAGVLDGVDEESTPYLVMELITGPTLAHLLRDGPLAEAEVARIGLELATTLAYVHANNVVHRDIKPANILLDTDHPALAPFTTKLADFGISRVTGGARFTTHGTTVGTANYLSPEQAQGLEVSGTSDVYSLGLVLIESLTGNVVYPGAGIDAALARLQRPATIPTRFGPHWHRLLTAMTGSDPTTRPTAAALAAMFAALPQSDPALPGAISPTSSTEVLTNLPPTSTAILSAPLTTAGDIGTHGSGGTSRGRLVGAAVTLALLATILIAVLSSSRSTSLAPKPAYPAVSGQVGVDLKRLEGVLP